MSVRRDGNKNGPAALQAWAKQVTDGYKGVSIRNMTTCWRDGLAFCALIHRYHPELIDYDGLDKSDILGNCSLAFEIAESKLGIPALLDPQDMLEYEVPDKLSILTYVAQFYNALKNSTKKSPVQPSGIPNENSPAGSTEAINKVGLKRPGGVDSDDILEATRVSGPKRPVLLSSQAVCTVCTNPVFLLERVIFSKKLYHRTCFRCSKCDSILNPHTVDVSPDGQRLFCIEKECQRELQELIHPRSSFYGVKSGVGKPGDNVVTDGKISGWNQQVSEAGVVAGEEPSDRIVLGDVTSSKSSSDGPGDRLNVREVEPEPGESGERRSVSFAGIVQVAKIGSDPAVSDDAVAEPPKVEISSRSQVQSARAKFLNFMGDELSGGADGQKIPPVQDEMSRSGGTSTSPATRVELSYADAKSSVPAKIQVSQVDGQKPIGVEIEPIPANEPPLLPAIGIETIPANQPPLSPAVGIQPIPAKEPSLSPAVVVGTELNDSEITSKIPADSEVISNDDGQTLPASTIEPHDATLNFPAPAIQANPNNAQIPLQLSPEFPAAGSTDVEKVPAIPISKPPRAAKNLQPSTEPVESTDPQRKHPNTVELLKGNLAAIKEGNFENSTHHSELETESTEKSFMKDSDPPANIISTTPTSNVMDVKTEGQDLISHNESGVGDSFIESDSKSDNFSPDSSVVSEEVRVPSESGESTSHNTENLPTLHQQQDLPDGTENDQSPQVKKLTNQISPSNTSNEQMVTNNKPVVTPRKHRSKSPTSTGSPIPSPRKKTSSTSQVLFKVKDYYPTELNPFESEDSLVIESSPPAPKSRTSTEPKGRLTPPNPFEEDDDEVSSQDITMEITPPPPPAAAPLLAPKSPVNSIKSMGSGTSSIRSRKTRRAPLPPSMVQSNAVVSPSKRLAPPPPPGPPPVVHHHQSPGTPPEKRLIPASPDLLKGLKEKSNKATAQQYRKKRRAPPPKRHVTPLPEEAIKTELADLTIKARELERQGITLEGNIRKLMSQDDDSNLSDQIDEMVIQLWNIVNEKNDIVRRQTELDYLRRGHRLEQMQVEVEFQLRMLMETPAEQRRSDQDEVEQGLLQQLLKIVDERNEVVDWLDFHRQMDREEDLHVSQSLTSFSSSSLSRSSTPTPSGPPTLVLPMESERVLPVEEEVDEKLNGPLNGSPKTNGKEESGKAGKKENKFKIGFFSLRRKKTHSKSKKHDEEKDRDESLKIS